MKSQFDYTGNASFIGNIQDTLAAAVELGSDSTWAVAQISPRRYGLFVGRFSYMLPGHVTVVQTNDEND